MLIEGIPLIEGEAEGTLLKLTAPICFWGGLHAATATIVDPHHPQVGKTLYDKIVAIPAIVGSSSSSQFLLELMLFKKTPRAILLGDEDFIIAMAVIVGREMGYDSLPIIHCDLEDLPDGENVMISKNGQVRFEARSQVKPLHATRAR
jgi:predicted aconitase with swiveling domain